MTDLHQTLSDMTHSVHLKNDGGKRAVVYLLSIHACLTLGQQSFLTSILKPDYLIKGVVFVLSVFQLKLPILMRPGHWSRRSNTD
jgi:hypothetical protein